MLDKRLEMIYDLMPSGRLCDIGTDHCKLAVYSVLSGKSVSALATDIRKGPLSAANRTVAEYGVGDKITTMLSDGFDDIPSADFDSIDVFTVAGMGGELIADILSRRHTDKTLVLQPMTAVNELTEYLCENGYRIEKRTFCKDKDKIYTAMRVRYDGIKRDFDMFSGCSDTELFREYYNRELEKTEKAITGIKNSDKSDKTRLVPLERIKKTIEEKLK